jgi:hypothetical protein
MYRIVHEAPEISAVPPGLRPLIEAALAKDPQARPTAPQLLAELTNSRLTSPGYDNPTQTVLAQTWHPSATGPMGPAPVPTGQRFAGQGLTGPGGPRSSRRRKALIPVVLTLAFLLAAGGTVLGLALAGKPASPAASGSTTAPASSPVQPSSSAATAPTSPAASTTSPASTPASTPPTTPVSTPVSTAPAALPMLTVGSYTGMKPTEIAYSGDATNVVLLGGHRGQRPGHLRHRQLQPELRPGAAQPGPHHGHPVRPGERAVHQDDRDQERLHLDLHLPGQLAPKRQLAPPQPAATGAP